MEVVSNILKCLLSLCIASCVGCATKPTHHYRSDCTFSLPANASIPRMEGEADFDYRLAGMQFTQAIEDNTLTNGFDEMDDAALAILDILIPLSRETNVEYGGYIYKKDDRFYFTNPPVKGAGIVVDVHLAERLVPEDASITGDYHTHFKKRPTERDTDANIMTDYEFSRVDIEGIKDISHLYSDYKGYLGTPDGYIQVFAPHSDVAFYTAGQVSP
jgi:hypothetical protein